MHELSCDGIGVVRGEVVNWGLSTHMLAAEWGYRPRRETCDMSRLHVFELMIGLKQPLGSAVQNSHVEDMPLFI